MKKFVALLSAAALLSSVAALAGPPAKSTKKSTKTAKVTDVWTCPMTGETVKDKSDKGTVCGSYRVHFCCPSCAPSFAKLSDKDKKMKAADAAKKDAVATKKS